MVADPQVVIAAAEAAGHALNMVRRRLEHHHAQSLADIEAAMHEVMVKGTITLALIKAIEDGSRQILDMCAMDLRSCLELRHEYARALLATDAKNLVRQITIKSSATTNEANLVALRRDAMAYHGVVMRLLIEAAKALGLSRTMTFSVPRELSASYSLNQDGDS
jgi:hypothetical protein